MAANYCSECGQALSGTRKGDVRKTARRAYEPKKKPRKLSAHNRFMSKELKRLRKKQPRTGQTKLFQMANRAWRAKKRRR